MRNIAIPGITAAALMAGGIGLRRVVEPNVTLPPPLGDKPPAIVKDSAVLEVPSLPYEGTFGDELERLTDRMLAAMYHTNQGVGLAAVQIGVHLRVCVVDIYALNPGRRSPRVFVNPDIELIGRKAPMREGCLSAPGKFGDVDRAFSIAATWTDEHGDWQSAELGGMLAHVLQHEVDHMDGIMCTSKMVRA